MDRTAQVHAIEAVDAMAAALRQFGEELATAIDNLQGEAHRAVEWIDVDRRKYWEGELQRSWNRLSEARVDLQKAQTYQKVAGQTPSCREERKAIERAKMRLDDALQKVETVRHWAYAIQHGVLELSGPLRQVADWVQTDLPRALVVLERMSGALEAYTAQGGLASAKPQPVPSAIRTTSPETPEGSTDEKLGRDEPGSSDQTGGEGPGSGPSGDCHDVG